MHTGDVTRVVPSYGKPVPIPTPVVRIVDEDTDDGATQDLDPSKT